MVRPYCCRAASHCGWSSVERARYGMRPAEAPQPGHPSPLRRAWPQAGSTNESEAQHNERFPDALAAMLAGSAGTALCTATSDLDILVFLGGPPAPFRETAHEYVFGNGAEQLSNCK